MLLLLLMLMLLLMSMLLLLLLLVAAAALFRAPSADHAAGAFGRSYHYRSLRTKGQLALLSCCHRYYGRHPPPPAPPRAPAPARVAAPPRPRRSAAA